MNKVILMGRLARDPEVRYTTGQDTLAIARFTLAVDRRMKREDQINADFISCVSFGRQAEFAEKYFHQGLKIAITGHIQTGSYKNREINRNLLTHLQQMHLWMFRIRLMKNFHLTDYATKF